MNLVNADDFTGSLLDLLQFAQEVEETRLGDDLIGGEDAHLEELRIGLIGISELAADDLVFTHHGD
jgi:hypothetical protein